ncbi:molybdate ABC transporter substrate-binding protein, partial [Amaricoccus sp. HAR-UPW-R2A-40]
IVPEALHAPIRQDAVLLEPGRDSAAARAFLDFRQVRRRHGR